ncbi:protein FAM185A isoform X4 [Notamacropus eugenii]|uniref:protein FAM185A isoform X4 n=1 Tax=Notamacropus eugenii TaxID=9315 RepID=UPI003B674319
MGRAPGCRGPGGTPSPPGQTLQPGGEQRSPDPAQGVDAGCPPVRAAAGAAPVRHRRETPRPLPLPGRRPGAGHGERRGGRQPGPGQPPDLNIRTSGSGSVKVQEAECDDCRIETEQGISFVQSVKSKKLHIQTKGGKVICLGTILGNIDIHASEKSTVTVDKLQGSSVNISTEDGLLKAKYLYTESSSLSSTAGDITLGSIHGDLTVHSKTGNITVDSLNGCLKASTHEGAVDVYVSQMGNVDLKSQKGSITIKVPSSLKGYLHLSGSKVDVNPEITLQEMTEVPKDNGITINGHMNQTSECEKWIKANAPSGTVFLKSQSWFQSLRLKDF